MGVDAMSVIPVDRQATCLWIHLTSVGFFSNSFLKLILNSCLKSFSNKTVIVTFFLGNAQLSAYKYSKIFDCGAHNIQ